MGCVENITFEKFPKQADENYIFPHLGKRVSVCYHFDTSKLHYGTIVRYDIEEPFETIIKLDNGRYVRAVECQFSIHLDRRDRMNKFFIITEKSHFKFIRRFLKCLYIGTGVKKAWKVAKICKKYYK